MALKCNARGHGVAHGPHACRYNVGHRGRTSLFGIGVFGGSNGCWRRDLLERIGMDHTMLTEDIDSSLRATRLGAKIGYSSYLNSSEEAPATEKTLRKQRLRWAQGWTEVSLKHLVPLMFSPYTSFRQKLGFFTLLGCAPLAASPHTCLQPQLPSSPMQNLPKFSSPVLGASWSASGIKLVRKICGGQSPR